VQQFSEVGGSESSLGDLMDGAQAVVYFPLDIPSVLLGGAGSDDAEIYRNVQGVSRRALVCSVTRPLLACLLILLLLLLLLLLARDVRCRS
jgi:hypothetical protein